MESTGWMEPGGAGGGDLVGGDGLAPRRSRGGHGWTRLVAEDACGLVPSGLMCRSSWETPFEADMRLSSQVSRIRLTVVPGRFCSYHRFHHVWREHCVAAHAMWNMVSRVM